MTETTISETSYTTDDGREVTQYRTTVPKALAEALELGGETVEWEVASGNSLILRKVKE